ncbi:hypothetical protein J5N97_000381 [Dioscorea zingiberensis]|uniref:ZCF37 n=1 Tax=Dioscorea zingiberensis TaxID=325984 RepID=A0A9D5H343_9LILI|nr:hypothetical protein J5N97_000381 [Dioscorea zingiberensis]
MFCGTGSLSHVDEEPCAPSTPKETKKKNKNPYSTRGLDKFSAVMAELEARKEKIMAKTGSKEAPMVRFMYNNSNDWVPIIIKLRDDKKEQLAEPKKKPVMPVLPESPRQEKTEIVAAPEKSKVEKKPCNLVVSEGEGCSWWRWRPSYYWPVVMVLILSCLVVFGKTFAICCTSIWWYLVPSMQGSSSVRRALKKRDYGRRLSDKKLGVVIPSSAPSHGKNKGGGEVSSPKNNMVNGRRG